MTFDDRPRSSDGLREQIRDTLAAHREVITTATRRHVTCKCICGHVICEYQKPYAPQETHNAAFDLHLADAVLAAIEEGNQ